MTHRRRAKPRSDTPSAESSRPRAIGELLTDLMARRGYAQSSAADECQQAWNNTVGEIAPLTRVGGFKNGVLRVLVSNSMILQELVFRQEELVNELRRALPRHRIKGLRFHVGRVD